MSRRILCRYGRLLTAVLAAVVASQSATAGVKTRSFSFENGTVASPAATILNSVTGPYDDVPDTAFNPATGTKFIDSGGPGIGDGTLLGDYLTNEYNPNPTFTASGAAPTYVNVANGSPLDSPAPGSNVGLQFAIAGNNMTSQGFRGTFFTDDAVAANAPASNGGIPAQNTQTSFTVFHQAWVRPDSASQGTSQMVWSLGTDLGGPRINANGFWEIANVSVIPDTASARPVSFGNWQHVAILRTGGAATLYINGAVAVAAQNFFGAFPNQTDLGSGIGGSEPFHGVIDNFSIGGTGGRGFVLATDVDYFADVGLPPPTGVAGDVNQDGLVNQADYNTWSANVGFNNTFGVGDLTTLVKGDLDGNGKIDFFDFRIIARQAAAAGATLTLGVPEPASGALIMFVAAAGMAFRRRSGVC